MSPFDDVCAIGILIVVTAFLVFAPFFTSWPWRWHDHRKIRRFLEPYGAKDITISGRFLARWERVRTLRWIPVREYRVAYADQEGRQYEGLAEFYLPWWINKLYDAGVLDGFDWTEEEVTRR